MIPMKNRSGIINYALHHIEFSITAFILAGLITFNKSFAYVGFGSLYITEFMAALCVIGFAAKLTFSFYLGQMIFREVIIEKILLFWPLLLILIYSLVRITMDVDYGFQTIRHSMIFMYTIVFILLFMISIKNEKQFFFLVVYLLIIGSSLFNGSKIIIYKLLGYTFNYNEPERVLHNETDIICAILSLLGLLVYRNFFFSRSRVLYVILILFNITILFLTVKRSAVACIIPSLFIYLYVIRDKVDFRKVFLLFGVIVLLCVVSLTIWYSVDQELFTRFADYLSNKASWKEKNALWRIQAWAVAWEKFLQSPWFGIGYGPKILDSTINNVDTYDPHNSLLAFLVRHGVFVTMLYVFFIIKSYVLIAREITLHRRNTERFNNMVFVCLGLTAMLIFSFFNVVLENQYEGIFFNFFLCAPYVLTSGTEKIQQVIPTGVIKRVGYVTLLLAFGFIFYALSPFNTVTFMPIYSAKTNHSLPVIADNSQSMLKILSKKNDGIRIMCTSYDSGAVSELYWTFPVQAQKLDLKEYSVYMETDLCQTKGYEFFMFYDNNERVPVESHCKGKMVNIKLSDVPQRLYDNVNIKFIGMKFSGVVSIENLLIENIYIKRNSNYQEEL